MRKANHSWRWGRDFFFKHIRRHNIYTKNKSEGKTFSHMGFWLPSAQEEEQNCLLLLHMWATPKHSPWKMAAFWMTRNFSSMLADCRSCSMFSRAAAWYFSSIFLEQHVEPFGIHTCRSDPRDTNKCKKLAWGGRIVASVEETYSMHWYHCNYCLGKLMTFLEFVLSKQLSQRRGLIRESQDCWAIAPESSLHTHANTMLALAPMFSIPRCAGAEPSNTEHCPAASHVPGSALARSCRQPGEMVW